LPKNFYNRYLFYDFLSFHPTKNMMGYCFSFGGSAPCFPNPLLFSISKDLLKTK